MTFPSFNTGDVLTAADMNAVGLWLVKSQTIGSTVSQVIVTDCFTTTYDNYLIRFSDVSTTADNADLNLQLRTGSTTANTNYNCVYQYVTYSGASSTFSAGLGISAFNFAGRSTNDTLTVAIDISQPRLARRTNFRAITPGGNITGTSSGFHDLATAYESIVFTLGAGTMTGGTIRVYGYRN
jgi:hypothetical protein